MRVLTATLWGVLVLALGTIAPALIAVPTNAHPPNSTDHGVPSDTFYTLWSRDADAYVNASAYEALTGESRPPMQELANGTDIPLDAPPMAVERWNRGELQEFPATDTSTSIHPPDATLTDGRFIKDAYIELFAIQPSTHARLSPGAAPLYVAPNGYVLGTTDFRVSIPTPDRRGVRRVVWTLLDAAIVEVRLKRDGRTVAATSGTHTPVLAYEGLTGEPTVTLEATITARFERHSMTKRQRCQEELLKPPPLDNTTSWNNTTTTICWTEWNHNYDYPVETLTVQDSITVVAYDLSISGYRARYPNGDLGLVVYRNHPWLGHTLPNGDVRGVWRFYAARDTDWDALVTSTASGEDVRHSPLHPLQVNAYPIETGPTPTPWRTITIVETYGVQTKPPTLPTNVHLDVLSETYTASFGIATRTRTEVHDLSSVTAYGLVRGVNVQADEKYFAEVPINRSNLTLTVLDKTDETVTVQVSLRDANTGAPINTADREGHVVLDGERVNTSENGTVTRTLPRPAGGISARYEPGTWWRDTPGYTGDSDVVYVRGTILYVLSMLYRIGVPVSLFLLGVFLIDRITGWRVWPPWRRL